MLHGHVDGRAGSDHHKAHAMVHGVHRQLIGADLVGHIAIGSNAVRPDDDPGDTTGFHQVRGSRVDIHRDRDTVSRQLPGSQARALQPGPGFVGIYPLK